MVNVDKIKALAKSKGISITFLCKQFSLSASYLNDVKAGKTTISDERLKTIADILNTTPEYLRDETDIKEKAAPNEQLLTENQRELIAIADRLSDEDYQKVLEYVEFLISKRNS